MTNEILRQYPLEPIVRREFLKRASLATLVWGASPRVSFAQTAATGSLLIQGGLIVTSDRQMGVRVNASWKNQHASSIHHLFLSGGQWRQVGCDLLDLACARANVGKKLPLRGHDQPSLNQQEPCRGCLRE